MHQVSLKHCPNCQAQITIKNPLRCTHCQPTQHASALRGKGITLVLIIAVTLLGLVGGAIVGIYFWQNQELSQEQNTSQIILHHMVIVDAYTKRDPAGSGRDLDYCDVSSGPGGPVEALVDKDQWMKTNSGTIFALCHQYAENSNTPQQGKSVTLVVAGIRDTAQSQFRNILYFIPDNS